MRFNLALYQRLVTAHESRRKRPRQPLKTSQQLMAVHDTSL